MDADRLKTTMTISKAIALMTDKHSVSEAYVSNNRLRPSLRHCFQICILSGVVHIIQYIVSV